MGLTAAKNHLLLAVMTLVLFVLATAVFGHLSGNASGHTLTVFPISLTAIAAILGGLGSLKGAVAGGFVIGFIEVVLTYSPARHEHALRTIKGYCRQVTTEALLEKLTR